jgi:rifampicin phosphotransferase
MWTTVNVAEAAPGVHTPLGWSIWGDLAEAATARSTIDLGAWPRNRVLVSADPDERFGAIFFGRYAINVNTFRAFGDRLPGSSGDAVEEQLFPAKRSSLADHPVRRRYPVVAVKLPVNLIRAPRMAALRRAEAGEWWRRRVFAAPPHGFDQGRELLGDAAERFQAIMRVHLVVTMLAQGAFEQLGRTCRSADRPGLERALAGGYGGSEESRLVDDIRRLSRGALDERGFLSMHGYHGPAEGDVSSRSWREDPTPVLVLAQMHAAAPVDDTAAAARITRERAEVELRRELGWARAALLEPLLWATRRLVLSREIGKAGFLIALDGIRAAARAVGAGLAAGGLLDAQNDVFFLTLDELTGPHADLREVVAARRETYVRFQRMTVPEVWQGEPSALSLDLSPAGAADGTISGAGVSAGTVTGRARVLLNADAGALATFQPGEILICRVTDPSWAPVLSIAAAAVIDIGAALSHGAIVARELGIPCVIGTNNGTSAVKTGDLLRVDGDRGRVDVLEG